MQYKVKKYDFTRKPPRASGLWMSIANIIIKKELKGHNLTIERHNMEGLKAPYLLLATHASETDFPVMYRAIRPEKRANNIVAIDAVRDHGDWLMRKLGCIAKRKFVKDMSLIRNMRYCVSNYGNIVCMYPEARYTLDGCESYLPPSVGKFCKLLGVPVVVLRMDGTFIARPQWNKKIQKVPLHATITQIVTAEETKTLSVEEINERIHANFKHDDFAYQRDNNIHINYANRADGLHNILYRCPHCGTEFEMYSAGTRLWCEHCGKGWQMTTLGQLEAEEGETEFSHIPDWFRWERGLVREEVRNGKYHFEDEVDVHTLPNAKRFYSHGKGKLVQTVDGTTLDCVAYGKPVHLEWKAVELESVHIEYDYPYEKKKYKHNIFGDCLDFSVPDESYWLHPATKRDQLTKISFATEEIYFLAQEKIKHGK